LGTNESDMVEGARYLRPTDLSQALAMAGRLHPRLIAGGTDFLAAQTDHRAGGDVLDLSALPELRDIERVQRSGKTFLRIGAMATWSDMLQHAELASTPYLAMRQCSREVGGQQIQNRGTLIGNVCNASPAADGIPVLMALGASLEIRSLKGQRWLPLEMFVLGPRKVALEPGEIVTAVEIPLANAPTKSLFLKMGSRRYLVISIAMLAAQWRPGKNGFCRIALGACAPVARRLEPLERWYLDGMPASQKAGVLRACVSLLSPIDDVRADHLYRHHLALALCDKLIIEMNVTTEATHG
jgi:CO/xanthine dehydrogenase FAD-binding subunit